MLVNDVKEKLKGQYTAVEVYGATRDHRYRLVDDLNSRGVEYLCQEDDDISFKVDSYRIMDVDAFVVGLEWTYYSEIYEEDDRILVIIVDMAYYPVMSEEAIPEPTDKVLAEALYVVNKHAKKARDRKNEAYNDNNPIYLYEAKSEELCLYAIKSAAINKLENEGRITRLGYHINKARRPFRLYRLTDYTFHSPCDIEELGDTTDAYKQIDTISAEITRTDVTMDCDVAVTVLLNYSGISDDDIDNYRVTHWNRFQHNWRRCLLEEDADYDYEEDWEEGWDDFDNYE